MARKSKKSGSSGKRGKKKHGKELKRKSKLASPASSPGVRRERDCSQVKEGIEGLARRLHGHYYAVAHELADCTTADLATLPSAVCTPARIAALSTGELVARLGAVGIATTEAGFLAAAAAESSAVRFAERAWLPLLAGGSTVHDRDLARLAACELWRRLRPEAPSIEMILDLYLAGAEHASVDAIEPALGCWLSFFDQVRPRLTPSITTLAALDALLDHGLHNVDDWLALFYELAMDLGGRAPDLTRRVAAVLRDVARQLSGEPADWQMFLAEQQARLLAAIDAKAEGEQVLRAMIARFRPDADHYMILVDFLTDDESDDRHDLRGAIEALESAKATLPDPKQHWSFDERIAELRERLGER